MGYDESVEIREVTAVSINADEYERIPEGRKDHIEAFLDGIDKMAEVAYLLDYLANWVIHKKGKSSNTVKFIESGDTQFFVIG